MTLNVAAMSYKATGGITPRTLGARAGDWFNVFDYGAKGDGVTDDSGAFQAAINAAVSRGPSPVNGSSATVYIPAVATPNFYKFANGANVTFNPTTAFNLIIRGDGIGSQIQGNVAGYIFDHSIGGVTAGVLSFENLYISNSNSAGGGIRCWNHEDVTIKGCHVIAPIGYDLNTSAPSATIINSSCSTGATAPAGSIGMIIGGQASIISCYISSYADGIRVWGPGNAILGCQMEKNSVAINVGTEVDGTNSAAEGLLIAGMSFEANDYAIKVEGGMDYGVIQGISIQGTNQAPSGQSIYGVYIPNTGSTYSKLSSIGASGGFTQYGILLGDNLSGHTVESCHVTNPTGVGTWSISPKCGAQIRACNIPAPSGQTFALAPSSPNDGDLWTFTDSNTVTFGATIAGSGSNRVVGRYSANGAVWTVAALAP